MTTNQEPRHEVIESLASMVIEQADLHGFAIEVDAIRDAVDQMAKFANIDATEAELVRASERVEEEAGLEAQAAANGAADDFVKLHERG